MISGLEDETIINEAKGLGAVDFIHKPFILDNLERIVMEQLRS